MPIISAYFDCLFVRICWVVIEITLFVCSNIVTLHVKLCKVKINCSRDGICWLMGAKISRFSWSYSACLSNLMLFCNLLSVLVGCYVFLTLWCFLQFFIFLKTRFQYAKIQKYKCPMAEFPASFECLCDEICWPVREIT